MRPVKTALVKELIDRRAIWTNAPAKGPGSGCRRFYPTAPEATPQSAIASPEPDTALHPATTCTPAQQESQPQSVILASDRDRPEQSRPGTVYAPAQQEPQLQSAVPTSEQLSERDRPEQSHSATASTLAQESPLQSATLALERAPEPEFPECSQRSMRQSGHSGPLWATLSILFRGSLDAVATREKVFFA